MTATESATDSFSGGSCDEERKNNWENVDTLQDHVLDPSDRGTCGSEQFKHGDHYSGNRCDPDLCSKPEICAVCLDGTRSRDQRTKKIPASGCNHEKAPDQKQKQKNDNPRTCESKLFTNN